jgi:hypothetical protein
MPTLQCQAGNVTSAFDLPANESRVYILQIERAEKGRSLSDMGREQMRNLEISKIGGANQVNEFEYQKHQAEISEQEHPGQQGGADKRLTQAERVKQVTAAAHKKVEKKRKKEKKSGSRKRSGK